eukprot:1508687-Rhodomonas_salina.1
MRSFFALHAYSRSHPLTLSLIPPPHLLFFLLPEFPSPTPPRFLFLSLTLCPTHYFTPSFKLTLPPSLPPSIHPSLPPSLTYLLTYSPRSLPLLRASHSLARSLTRLLPQFLPPSLPPFLIPPWHTTQTPRGPALRAYPPRFLPPYQPSCLLSTLL